MTEYMEGEIKLVVIGNTNVGKSTYLNNLLGVSNFLNISEIRETACLWIIKSHTEKPDFELKANSHCINNYEVYAMADFPVSI